MKPNDHTHGYQTILGNTQVSGLTLANFEGAAACGGAPDGPVYAMSNHLHAPDASHPVSIKQVRPTMHVTGCIQRTVPPSLMVLEQYLRCQLQHRQLCRLKHKCLIQAQVQAMTEHDTDQDFFCQDDPCVC
jgi:hypothetical protein